MIIPHESLSHAALQNLIEAHVLQEGTDYGGVETEFQTKCRQVEELIRSNKACIVYDANTNSADIRMKETLGGQPYSKTSGHFLTEQSQAKG